MYNIYMCTTVVTKIIAVQAPDTKVAVLHQVDLALVEKNPVVLKSWLRDTSSPFTTLEQFKEFYIGEVTHVGRYENVEGVVNILRTLRLVGVTDV